MSKELENRMLLKQDEKYKTKAVLEIDIPQEIIGQLKKKHRHVTFLLKVTGLPKHIKSSQVSMWVTGGKAHE